MYEVVPVEGRYGHNTAELLGLSAPPPAPASSDAAAPEKPECVIEISALLPQWTVEWTKALAMPRDSHDNIIKRLMRMKQVRFPSFRAGNASSFPAELGVVVGRRS